MRLAEPQYVTLACLPENFSAMSAGCRLLVAAVVVAVSCIACGDAMVVRLQTDKEQCFAHLSEHQDTELVVHYSAQRFNTNGWLQARIRSKETGKEINRFELSTRHRELISFKVPEGGWYLVCFINHNEQGREPFDLWVRIEETFENGQVVGTEENDGYDVPASLDDLGPKFSAVHWQIKGMRGESVTLRKRQEQFEETVDSTHFYVVVFTVLNVVILLGTTLWQTTHLQKFFKEKKVV